MAQFTHIAHGAAWSIAGKVLQLLLNLVTFALVARLVGPEAYGVYALGWLALGLFDIVVGGAPTDTLIQRKVASAGHFNATFWATLVIALLGWMIVWQGADTISMWLNGGALLAAILPVRAVVFVLRALGVGPGAQLVRESRFRDVAKAEMLASVVSNLIGISMALAGAGIWSLVGMEVSRALIITLAGYWMTRWRPGLAMCWTDLMELAAFNLSSWGAWGLAYVQGQLPRLLIGWVLGPIAVGYYALAQRLGELVSETLVVPSYNVVQAGISRAQDDRVNARKLASNTFRIVAVLACPMFMGIAALAPILVPTVFGLTWIDSVPVVQLLMLVGIRYSLSMIQAAVIRGMGKPHLEMLVALVSVGLATVLILIAVPYGLVPGTVAFLVSGMLMFPLQSIYVTRLIGLTLTEQTVALGQAGIAACVMAAVLLAIAPFLVSYVPAIAAMAILIPLGGLIYWAMLKVIMPAAAAVMEQVLFAIARRDFGALRASLGGMAG